MPADYDSISRSISLWSSNLSSTLLRPVRWLSRQSPTAKPDELSSSQDPHGRRSKPAIARCPLTCVHTGSQAPHSSVTPPGKNHEGKCKRSFELSVNDKCWLSISEESDKEMHVHLYLLPTPCVYVQIERCPRIGFGKKNMYRTYNSLCSENWSRWTTESWPTWTTEWV